MSSRKSVFFTCISVLAVLSACASAPPRITEPQFIPHHYTFSILYDTSHPGTTPQLDLAMTLLRMNSPAEQVRFFNEVLYAGDDPFTYRDRIIREQREHFRSILSALEWGHEDDLDMSDDDDISRQFPHPRMGNWRYSERIHLESFHGRGMQVTRMIDTYTGGAHGMVMARHFPMDLENLRLIRIDDLFQDYQGDRTRAVIYDELRRFNGLQDDLPLSEGIYNSDEPELTFNFFFTEEGLGLYWDPYAIAPYSAGGIEIIIPWRRIRPWMLHSGMELLTKFDIDILS